MWWSADESSGYDGECSLKSVNISSPLGSAYVFAATDLPPACWGLFQPGSIDGSKRRKGPLGMTIESELVFLECLLKGRALSVPSSPRSNRGKILPDTSNERSHESPRPRSR